MKICEAMGKTGLLDYRAAIRGRGDSTVKQIIADHSYKTSVDPAYRYWYRLALMEARRRGLS